MIFTSKEGDELENRAMRVQAPASAALRPCGLFANANMMPITFDGEDAQSAALGWAVKLNEDFDLAEILPSFTSDLTQK